MIVKIEYDKERPTVFGRELHRALEFLRNIVIGFLACVSTVL